MEYAALKGVYPTHLEPNFTAKKHQRYVNFDVMVNLIRQLNQRLGDENLGMHVGELISLKATTQVDGIMLNSQTLEDSLNNAINYSKLISDALDCSLHLGDSTYSIVYEENPNWSVYPENIKKQILDLALLSNVKSLAAYTNHVYYPTHIHFTYSKPKHINEYYRLFNCSLTFNRPRTEIFYDRHILKRQGTNLRNGLLESLKEKVANEIDDLKIEDRIIYKLKLNILEKKPERLTIQEAAEKVNTSVRSLQRKLATLDTSFKSVELELTIRLAKTYLEERQKSVEEIGYLLGFSESSAFIRFFKLYTGKTPKTYQKATIQTFSKAHSD